MNEDSFKATKNRIQDILLQKSDEFRKESNSGKMTIDRVHKLGNVIEFSDWIFNRTEDCSEEYYSAKRKIKMEWTCALTPEDKPKYIYLIKPAAHCSQNSHSEKLCSKAYVNHEDALSAISDLINGPFYFKRSDWIIEYYDLCLKYTGENKFSECEPTQIIRE